MSHNLVQLRRNRGDLGVQDNALSRLKKVMEERRGSPGTTSSPSPSHRQPEAAVYGIATYYADLGVRRAARRA